MPAIKFDFVPERHFSKSAQKEHVDYRVTIAKRGYLLFSSDVVNVYDLDQKFIKFFADKEKRAIGWSIIEGSTDLEELTEARKINKNKVSNMVVISIGKLLKALGCEKGTTYKNLEVKTYKSQLNTDDIFYIELPKKEAKLVRSENGVMSITL